MSALPRVVIENYLQNPPRSTARQLVAAFEQLPGIVTVTRPNTAQRRIIMQCFNDSCSINETDLDSPLGYKVRELQGFALGVSRHI